MKTCILAFASSILLTPLAAFAQQAFEVASVKPYEFPPKVHVFGSGSTLRIAGNRVTILGTLQGIVMAAYNLREFQVSGAPSWTDKLGSQQDYQVIAKTEGEAIPTMDQARQMLRTLLADRFQLKVHSEIKELAVYDLVVAKNGPKLKEHVGETVPPQLPTQSGPRWRLTYSNRSIADLVSILDLNVDRPVIDKTGLTGGYDFTLEYTRSNPDVPGDSDTSIFSAIQTQLGLKLNPAKEQVEHLVIDHADKPSEN